MTGEKIEGGCRCGAIRFVALGPPRLIANCHCSDCRKATGSAFTTFVDYERDEVTFNTPPKSFVSSANAERLFCEHCGSPIAFRGEASPDEINIHLGAFDHPEKFQPSEECHQESALWRTK